MSKQRRAGFTLVELMVALALIIFIMAVLSQAFAAAAKSFRDLKAAGDLAEKLRAAAGMLRHDLGSPHFDGNRRLSDADFWLYGPPAEGFFRIWQNGAAVQDGADPEITVDPVSGVPTPVDNSYVQTQTALHFTVKLRGNNPSDYFTANIAGLPDPAGLNALHLGNYVARFEKRRPDPLPAPAPPYQEGETVFRSQWAEVAYFLRPSVNPATGQFALAGTTPLYTLYRRHLVAVPDLPGFSNDLINVQPLTTWVGTYGTDYRLSELSAQPIPSPAAAGAPQTRTYSPNQVYFNNARDLTVPGRRFGMNMAVPVLPDTNATSLPYAGSPYNAATPYPTLGEWNTSLEGGDVLLTDVVSMDVRVLLHGSNEWMDLTHPTIRGYSNGNPAFPPAGSQFPLVFDTWSQVSDTEYDYGDAPFPFGTPRWYRPNTYASIPLFQSGGSPIRIRAVRIVLRIYDEKTTISRQITIIQDV